MLLAVEVVRAECLQHTVGALSKHQGIENADQPSIDHVEDGQYERTVDRFRDAGIAFSCSNPLPPLPAVG